MLRRTLATLALAGFAFLVVGASPASAADLPPGGTFIDDDGDTHEGAIEALYAAEITKGCDERQIRYCPDEEMTRGQMAAFIDRALGLPPASRDYFSDDNSSIFENNINSIAESGITLGCNPPANTRYCPNRPITRAEMATLLARAFASIVPDAAPDAFTDDTGNVHEANINLIAAANITKGCNPPANTHFCPRDEVTRGQMASFLVRALGLAAIVPPPQKPIERVSSFTTYFDCCQNRVTNIRLMARTVDDYVVMPGETFSIDRVVGPTTASKGYKEDGYLVGGEGQCCVVGGGVSQFGTTMFNAIFWSGYEIGTFRPHTAWLSRYPLGIEHTLVYSSIDLKFTNDTTTPIYIRTSSTSTSVTVELWGNQGGWRMSGRHPRGNRNSVINVLDNGGSEAKRVSARVTGSAPGQVKIVRTLTQNGHSSNQTWYWTYLN
ncbi:MAG: VanW family protein [Acidimicrobiia bacterium]